MTSLPRDDAEIEALLTDRYLEALLMAAERGADDVPADAALPVDVRRAVAALRAGLVRVHPSFRFEERLASQLADLASGLRTPERARSAQVQARPPVVPLADPFGPDPELDPLGRARPYLIGGAMASAALSIAGAAIVAWRRSRTGSARPIAEVAPLVETGIAGLA